MSKSATFEGGLSKEVVTCIMVDDVLRERSFSSIEGSEFEETWIVSIID